MSTQAMPDGDCHVDIVVDSPYVPLLNGANPPGTLITEVIPAHRVPIPQTDSRVSVFGTWVKDLGTGWNELHPVWSYELQSGSTGACGG